MAPKPVNPDLPDGISDSEQNWAEAAETGRASASLDSSTRSSGSEQSQRIDTSTFNPSTVTRHYSTQIGGSHATTATAGQAATGNDDVFNLARHYQSAAVPMKSPKTAPFTTKGFFAQTDQYNVDQSVNFMDHNRANYTPPAPKRSAPRSTSSTGSRRTSFVDIFLSRRGGSSRDNRRGGSGSSTLTAGKNPDPIHEGGHSIWPRLAAWLLIFLSFGFGATFLALSVPHLARHSMAARTAAREDASRKRWSDLKACVLATGLTLQSELEATNSSQHYALRWLSTTDPARLEADDPGLVERYALATFFYSNHLEIAEEHSSGEQRRLDTKWVHHDRWMTRSDVCTWYGIECGTTPNNEVDILRWNMTQNKLRGSLPGEISILSSLELLDLSSNGLSGTLPIQIFEMKYLKQLILKNNGLSGTISNEIGYFYPAEEIDLSENLFKGILPSSINTLVNLRELALRDNELEGNPPDMSKLLQLGKSNGCASEAQPRTPSPFSFSSSFVMILYSIFRLLSCSVIGYGSK